MTRAQEKKNKIIKANGKRREKEKKYNADNGIKMKQEYYTRPMNNIACSGCSVQIKNHRKIKEDEV